MRGKLETPIAGLKGLRELHWNSPKQKSHLREKKKRFSCSRYDERIYFSESIYEIVT